jgi:ATP-dependent NAD(P)H-hydrate dehydratase
MPPAMLKKMAFCVPVVSVTTQIAGVRASNRCLAKRHPPRTIAFAAATMVSELHNPEVLRVPDYVAAFRKVIPDLDDAKLYKGATGKVVVVGGSEEYTGAPFYAASSALRGGGELASVYCASEAAVSIKSYSPDVIVYPGFDAISGPQKAREVLGGAHAVALGPGLGRSDEAESVTSAILMSATSGPFPPLVLDGDALYFLSRSAELLECLRSPSCTDCTPRIYLTPNANELRRLCDAVKVDDAAALTAWLAGDSPSQPTACVVLVQKGGVDRVHCTGRDGELWQVNVDTPGSRKRCGGQGDILAGLTALFAGWTGQSPLVSKDMSSSTVGHYVAAAVAACLTTRNAGARAFDDKGRSMVASDMLATIGPSFELL